MIIAGNQSYFFPYIGYFQLINAVDRFTFADNLLFINKGWVNRNRILIRNTGPFIITVPLINRKSNSRIRDIIIDDQNGQMYWRKKMCKTIYDNYKRAPYFNTVYPFVEELIYRKTESLSELNSNSVVSVCEYLKIDTEIIQNPDRHNVVEDILKDEEYITKTYRDTEKKVIRILEICKFEGADTVYNSIGGASLYNKESFSKYSINLMFLKTKNITYEQKNDPFIPNLSIIDVMMFNSVDQIRGMLDNYEVI